MKPVQQTRFGGSDAPESEQGNCFQACIASILEIPLEDAFDVIGYDNGNGLDGFNDWLSRFGLAVWIIDLRESRLTSSMLKGIHLLECRSTTLVNPDDDHVVVIQDGEVVHDPNPNSQGLGEERYIYAFVALDAAKTARNNK